jgi:deoxycytidine triphosphate deaminase
MTQLSAQSIAELCDPDLGREECWHWWPGRGPTPMIHPFLRDKLVINGVSAGLSAASYDIRIAHDLTLGPHPGYLLWDVLEAIEARSPSLGGERGNYALGALLGHLRKVAPCFALAHSIEDFALPHDVAGYVCDKSSYARRGVSAFNTLFDPGFRGNATLELVNLSDREVFIRAGDPICQLVFHRLDRHTDRPYVGKYQDQPRKPVGAIMETSNEDGRSATGFQVDRP